MAITVGELQAPDEDPIAHNVVWIADRLCPGFCLPPEGENKRDVEHKKSKGSSRDQLLDQGKVPTEGVIKIRTVNGDELRALQAFYERYLNPDRALTKLNVVNIAHPAYAARGIKQGYFYAAPVWQPTQPGGIRPLIHEFRFKVVGPKTQIGAGSGSSKPKKVEIGGPTDPNFKPKGGTTNAVGLITTAAQLLPGVATQSKARPANLAMTIYPPTELDKIAKAGDPTAQFVQRIGLQSVPR